MRFDLPRQRQIAMQAVQDAPDGYVVTVRESKRTDEQNSLLWPLLAEVSAQVEWYGKHLTDEEWKSVFTAALKKTKVVPGIDGGFVVCGMSTSSMGKRDFSELLEIVYAFGAERGVKFADPHP